LGELYNSQRHKHISNVNKKIANHIQKECVLNCDINDGEKMIQAQNAKLKKQFEQLKPSMEE
jgi:hypothetical protein